MEQFLKYSGILFLFGIVIIIITIFTPNKFVNILNKLNPEITNKAFQNQLASLKNPPKTKEELVETLVNCNLKSAKKIFK